MTSAASATRNRIAGAVASCLKAIRAFFTPFRLIVMGMMLILLGTAAVAIHSRIIESARSTLRTELEAGQASLAEADYVAARGHFARAASAVQTLGTDDEQSRLVRQLHQETMAMTQLAPGSLFEMLEEAERQQQRPGATGWDDIFNVRYRGTWLVLQAPVKPDAAGFVVDLPLSVGEEHRDVVVRADLEAFERLTATDATPVIFAAPLAECRLDESAGRWLVRLDAGAGFLWSSLENLRPLGLLDDEWTDEEEIAALLQSQSPPAGDQ